MDRLLTMRVFQKVVDEGGFAAAARAMDMSAVSVTRLVADLEEHLGVRLLQRTTRRVTLTNAGEGYLARIRPILIDVEEAFAVAQADTAEMSGTLRLLAPPVLAVHILAPLVAEFRRLHPKITIEVTVDSPPEPPVEDYDITLIGTDANFNGNVIARTIFTSVAVACASPDYLRRRPALEQPEDLAQHCCLRLRSPFSRVDVWHMIDPTDNDRAVDVPVTPVFIANHTATLLRATLDGAGLSAQPVEIVAPYIKSGQLVRVLPRWITGRLTLYAAMPSRKFMPARCRAFLEFLAEQTRSRVRSVTQPSDH